MQHILHKFRKVHFEKHQQGPTQLDGKYYGKGLLKYIR